MRIAELSAYNLLLSKKIGGTQRQEFDFNELLEFIDTNWNIICPHINKAMDWRRSFKGSFRNHPLLDKLKEGLWTLNAAGVKKLLAKRKLAGNSDQDHVPQFKRRRLYQQQEVEVEMVKPDDNKRVSLRSSTKSEPIFQEIPSTSSSHAHAKPHGKEPKEPKSEPLRPARSSSLPSSVLNWTVENVGDWLAKYDLSQFREAFAINKMDGVALQEMARWDPRLQLEVLRDDLAVELLGDRASIISALQQFNTANSQ